MYFLTDFTAEDISQLINYINVEGAEFLMQFGGSKYSFPLTKEQVLEDINRENHKLFKYIDEDGTTAGHCQLLRISREDKSATIGRVLIYPEYRGKGHSKKMLKMLINYGKEELDLKKIYLRVFDFNKTALNCYIKLGFKQTDIQKNDYSSIGKTWVSISMEKSL